MAVWHEGDIAFPSGKTLHYYRTGGSKPPVVFAHGITDNGLCWAPIVYTLRDDFDCILYDAYGHGLSSRVSEAFEHDPAADLADFIKVLRLERPPVVGHSMGAVSALDCAARFPEAMRCVVLEDPPLIDNMHWLPGGEDMLNGAQLEQEKILGDLVSEFQANFPHRNPEEAIRMAVAREQIDLNFYSLPMHHRELDWRQLVQKIAVPLLLVTGKNERGAITSPDIAAEVVSLAQQGQHRAFDAGHTIRRDQPAAYIEAVRDFIQSVNAVNA